MSLSLSLLRSSLLSFIVERRADSPLLSQVQMAIPCSFIHPSQVPNSVDSRSCPKLQGELTPRSSRCHTHKQEQLLAPVQRRERGKHFLKFHRDSSIVASDLHLSCSSFLWRFNLIYVQGVEIHPCQWLYLLQHLKPISILYWQNFFESANSSPWPTDQT